MATVDDLVTSTSNFITSMQNQAATAVTALSAAASAWTTFSWSAVPAITLASSRPTITTDDSAITAALAAYTDALALITLPALATPPDLSSYTAPKWSETAWTNLKGLLTNFTSSITGSDDVDTVITKLTSDTDKLQVAMYAADLERKRQVLRDLYSAADASTGAKGFTYPNSMTVALKLDAQQKYQFDLSQTARTLIEKMLDWAKTNFQFAVQQGISAHNSEVDFNIRYAGTLVSVYETSVRTELDAYKSKISAIVEKLRADVETFRVRYELAKAKASVDVEYDRTQIMKFEADVKNHISDVQAGIQAAAEQAKNKIAAYAATAQAAAAITSSTSQIVVAQV